MSVFTVCPLCGGPPTSWATKRLSGTRQPYAFVSCRHCWRPNSHPEEPAHHLLGEGLTVAEAATDWNRQTALYWFGPEIYWSRSVH